MKNQEREDRIYNEIIVDCHDEEEKKNWMELLYVNPANFPKVKNFRKGYQK